MVDYAIMKQPTPVPGERIVLEAVLGRLRPEDLDVLENGLIVRAEKGKQDYGRYLETFNGRSSLVDLYQELLDAMMYVTQYQLELRGKWSSKSIMALAAFAMLRFLAVRVKKILDKEPVSSA